LIVDGRSEAMSSLPVVVVERDFPFFFFAGSRRFFSLAILLVVVFSSDGSNSSDFGGEKELLWTPFFPLPWVQIRGLFCVEILESRKKTASIFSPPFSEKKRMVPPHRVIDGYLGFSEGFFHPKFFFFFSATPKRVPTRYVVPFSFFFGVFFLFAGRPRQ